MTPTHRPHNRQEQVGVVMQNLNQPSSDVNKLWGSRWQLWPRE